MSKTIHIALLLSIAVAWQAEAQQIVALKKEIQRFGDPSENVADLIVELRQNLWKEVLLLPDPADGSMTVNLMHVWLFPEGVALAHGEVVVGTVHCAPFG